MHFILKGRWLYLVFCAISTFQFVDSETSLLGVVNATSVSVTPRGERKIRLRKKPTLGQSDISAEESFDRGVSSNFLQVIPFRLTDGTPMLRWRPVTSSTKDKSTEKNGQNIFTGTFVMTETQIEREGKQTEEEELENR